MNIRHDSQLQVNMLDAKIHNDKQIAEKQSESRFYMFFIGLIFATLSFIIAHRIETNCILIKIAEIIAIYSLFISAILILFKLEFFVEKYIHKFKKNRRYIWTYWGFYLFGMLLIIINRTCIIFLN